MKRLKVEKDGARLFFTDKNKIGLEYVLGNESQVILSAEDDIIIDAMDVDGARLLRKINANRTAGYSLIMVKNGKILQIYPFSKGFISECQQDGTRKVGLENNTSKLIVIGKNGKIIELSNETDAYVKSLSDHHKG